MVLQIGASSLFREGDRAASMAMGLCRIGVQLAVGRTDERLRPLMRRDRAVHRGMQAVFHGRCTATVHPRCYGENERHEQGSLGGAHGHIVRSTSAAWLGCKRGALCLAPCVYRSKCA